MGSERRNGIVVGPLAKLTSYLPNYEPDSGGGIVESEAIEYGITTTDLT